MSKLKALAAVAFSALAAGLPAGAGQSAPVAAPVRGLTVIDNPNPAHYQLNPGEQLLMVVPSMDASNRYVPPAQASAPAPEPAAPYPYRAIMRGGERPVHSAAGLVPVAEVANETRRRAPGEKPAPVRGEERIPWWKGGLWRNNDNNDEPRNTPAPEPGPDPVAARRGGGSAGRQAPRDPEADLWGDGSEYTGYNPDGSFGRQAPPPQPNYPNYNTYDPYAQQGAYNPYPQQGGYVSPPFTDPNAPLGAYVDPYAPVTTPYVDPYASGYATGPYDTSAYGTVPAIDASTGQLITPSAPPAYPSGPYAVQPGPLDPYAPLPAQTPQEFVAPPASAASGGPQFENAVRMVKENRFSEAKAILVYETVRDPANAAAWRWLADCHYNLLELDEAINCYTRSLELDPGDYYALRGQGFSHLHRGHEYWRRMQEEVARSRKEEAAATFSLAHEDYKKALEMLGLCLRRSPNDGEAIYGEAMAAEGASRKLYSNAISFLKLGPDQRERAELFAENCLSVINKGIERSRERSRQAPGDSGPRALLGGLYLRKATLYRQLGKNDLALIELRNARDAQRSILDEIDRNDATAQRALQEAESLWEQWGGGR